MLAGSNARRMVEEPADGIRLRVEPEIVLPAQYSECGAAMLQPEKRLMLAVLEEAVATFLRHRHARGGRERRAVSEVEDWIDSDDAQSTFAFVRICDALGLDTEYLRAGLARARGSAGHRIAASRTRPFRRIVAGTRHVIGAR